MSHQSGALSCASSCQTMESMPVASDMKPVHTPIVITGTFPEMIILQENELRMRKKPSKLVIGTARKSQSTPDMVRVLPVEGDSARGSRAKRYPYHLVLGFLLGVPAFQCI